MAKPAFRDGILSTMSNLENTLQGLAMEPVNGIIKDVSGAKLLPMTVSAYILWIVLSVEDTALLPVS